MLIPVLLFALGLVLLIKGGDWFVDGATGIAERFHVPEIIIGATVVSIGTTLPEVMVSSTSALTGHGEIAYGNAVGSIVCNTALIAALTVAVRPGPVDTKSLKPPVIFFFTSAAIFCLNAYISGYFSRVLGVVMLAIFALYLFVTVRQGFRNPAGQQDEDADHAEDLSMGKAAVLLVVMPQVFVWLSAAFGLMMDLKRPNLTWTNEITVIKQRLTVLITMLGGWIYAVVIGLLYLLVLPSWSAAWYLLACTALTAALTALLLRWLRTRGAALFAAL